MEVKGYTLRMQAKASSNSANSGPGPDQTLIPGCWLRVSSSGVIQCIINGRTASLTTTGQWFATNAQGILNILFATKDASCYKVLAEAFRPANTSEDSSAFRLLDAPILDPSRKVVSKLECIKSPQELRTAKTQTGELLISTNTSDDDVKKGAAAIKLLRDQIQNLEKRDNESLKVFRSTLAHQGQKSVYPVPFFWDEVLHGLGDASNWLREKAEEAWDWIVDKAGEFVRLVIKIGGEIFDIILDSISTVVNAVSWVFKKLGVLFDKLIAFLGFLFSWDDILDTTDSMVTMLNAGLDYGDQILTQSDADVKKWLWDLKATILAQLPVLSGYDFKGTTLNGRDREEKLRIEAAEPKHEESIEGGVASNWASYQLQYGGALSNATLKDSPMKNPETQKIKELWATIEAEMKTMADYVVHLVKDIVKVFEDGNFDVNTLISKLLSDTVEAVMETLTNLSDILFKAAELGISMVRGLCNSEIDVPVFTWLWKLISEGRPLTLGYFVSLLVAIPSTLLCKAVKGKAPPKLKGRVTESTFREYVETGSVFHDKSLVGDISSFNLCTAAGLGTIVCAVTTITLVIDGSISGGGLKAISDETYAQHPSDRMVDPTLDLPNWVGNAIDGVSLVLESAALVYSWPQRKHISEKSIAIQRCYWGAWLLEASNVAAIVITRAVGAYVQLPRVESKRWRGILAAATAGPILAMQLSYHIADYESDNLRTAANDSDVLAQTIGAFFRHVMGSTAEMGSNLGFALAAATDAIENEAMWVGLAIWVACKAEEIGFEVADFVLEE